MTTDLKAQPIVSSTTREETTTPMTDSKHNAAYPMDIHRKGDLLKAI